MNSNLENNIKEDIATTEEIKPLSFNKDEVPHNINSIEALIRNRIRNATGELIKERVKEDILAAVRSDTVSMSNIEEITSNNEEVTSKNEEVTSNNDNLVAVPEKYIDLFIPKRNQQKMMFEMLCSFASGSDAMSTDDIVELPKCLAYLTKRACQCDNKCVEDNSNIKFDSRCSLFDLKDLYSDIKYLDNCRRLALKPNNGVMEKYKFGNNIEKASSILNEDIENVCDGKGNINKATCSAYELRDECRNDEACMRREIRKLNCLYKENLSEIEKIVGFPITDFNVRNRRGVETFTTRLESYNQVPEIGNTNEVSFNICGGIMAFMFVIGAVISHFKFKGQSKLISVVICLLAAISLGVLTSSRALLN